MGRTARERVLLMLPVSASMQPLFPDAGCDPASGQ
jgi:hypothetical protein